MKYVGKQDKFRFHPRCKSLGLNHLCFADDMILFCKGEYQSVLMMLQGLKLFSNSTGLVANPNKSAIFGCGMDNQEMLRLVECSGFQQGKLPFRYLGVPISTKKLSAADSEQLIDRMIGRIRTWSSRNISFAGRRQLVNSVLMSICVYWAQIFMLPQAVMKRINAICRSYLWTGLCNSSKPGYVSWEDVCYPKCKGGLGFKSLLHWNLALVGKQAWSISMKADNLWVKWVHVMYVKQQTWDHYCAPKTASWAVKFISKAKNTITGMNGSSWLSNPQFSTADMYKKLTDHGQKQDWCKDIWNSHNVPKHGFISWLAMKNRLQTRARLHNIGICTTDRCLLCEDGVEDIGHLFFRCPFSSQVLKEVKNWMGIKTTSNNLAQLLAWTRRRFKGGKFKKSILIASIIAAVYAIWQERNNALWHSKVYTVKKVLVDIKDTVQKRNMHRLPKRISDGDREWWNKL